MKRVAVVLVALAALAVGMAAGWRLAGPSSSETEIGRVAFTLSPSLRGDVELVVPVADWGLRADAIDAPVRITGELRSLDRDAILRAAEGSGPVLDRLEEDLADGARAAVIRGFAWGLGTTLVLLAVITLLWRGLRPRWALAAVGGGLAVIAIAGSLVAMRATFDARAFQTPTYFGQGEEVQRLLEVANDPNVRSAYGTTVASILRSISTVLAEVPTGDTGGRTLTLASDLHANALVINPLSEAIGNDPFLLAGDFGQRGGEAESRVLAPRVAALGSEVFAVSGNHDSRLLMQRLAQLGVTVLGTELRAGDPGSVTWTAEVDGLRLAGRPDPLEWPGPGDPPDRPVTFGDLPDPEAAVAAELADTVEWFDSLSPRPDLVLIHQNGLAQAFAQHLHERGEDRELVIATGHDHRQHIDRYGKIIVVDGGSVGAGGVFDAGREAIGFARLHFSAATPHLQAVDLVAIEPFSGQARASRIATARLCPDEPRCSFEPPPLDGAGVTP